MIPPGSSFPEEVKLGQGLAAAQEVFATRKPSKPSKNLKQ